MRMLIFFVLIWNYFCLICCSSYQGFTNIAIYNFQYCRLLVKRFLFLLLQAHPSYYQIGKHQKKAEKTLFLQNWLFSFPSPQTAAISSITCSPEKHFPLIIINIQYTKLERSSRMQAVQHPSPPSTPQLKHRQLAEEYLKIQENTEFLTHILRYYPKKQRPRANLDDAVIDVRSIATVCVQFSYLLYTCCVKQTNLWLSVHPALLHPRRREAQMEVCLEYLLQKDYHNHSPEEQDIIRKLFKFYEFSHQNGAYTQYVLERLVAMVRLARSQDGRMKLPADKALCRQFLALENMCNILNSKRISNPRVTILSLEESELFREFSILVKSMNNTLFSAIRITKIKYLLPEIYKLEANYLNSRNKNKPEERYKLMERAIEDTIRLLIKAHILSIEQSVTQQGHDSKISQQYVVGYIEGQTIQQRKYSCRFSLHQKPLRQFTPRTFQIITQQSLNFSSEEEYNPFANVKKQTLPKNEFLVQYFPAKGFLSVKYITGLELGIENTDMLMFQCSSINYNFSAVSMEFVEKGQAKQAKKKDRFLGFKSICQLMTTESPIFQMLLMIDLTTVCAKISDPILRKMILRPDDYLLTEEVVLKVEHMMQLFLKRIEKFYKMVKQTQSRRKDY